MVANVDNTSRLWHQLLGHKTLGPCDICVVCRLLKTFHREPPSGVYEGGILGEHHQESFP
jgi:hypothetical protein